MLSVYTTKDAKAWDEIVKSFSEYDTYWLSGYVKAFEIHGDGEPLLFYFESENARGINVVMKRDIGKLPRFAGKIKEGTLFDFATVYGYGGWIIEGEDDALFNEYSLWCRENAIVSEFVRFHPMLQNQEAVSGCYDVVPLGLTVFMDISSDETIWANLTSKNRNMIRKAQKSGVEIHRTRDLGIYKTFRDIYNLTMDKDNADDYYYFGEQFYESVCYDLADNAQVFYATLEDKIIAASIMIYANGRMNYHLSGSLREYANLAPTNLLLYEAALWGFENGYKTLYMGGGVGSGEDSLFKFKKAFYRKDDLPRFHIGKRIFDEEKYEELLNLSGNDKSVSFFPQYRA
ncbi:MAG: GNAT family N-acetyltransferase [Clostridia bacterium]|nr:GNAT family N-acetyltransferase [Clostridia bacterium]